MNRLSKEVLLSEQWLNEHFDTDGDEIWVKYKLSKNESRPLTMRVLKSSEYKQGWYIALWDGISEVVLFDGVGYSVDRMENLLKTLSV